MIRLTLLLLATAPLAVGRPLPIPSGLAPSPETVVVDGKEWPASLTGTVTHTLRETYGGNDPATPWCQDGTETVTADVRLDLDRSPTTGGVRYVARAGTWTGAGSCAGRHTFESRNAAGQTVACSWSVSQTYSGGGAFPSDGAWLEVRPDADGIPEVAFGVVGETATENVVDCDDAPWPGGQGNAAWGGAGPKVFASASGLFPLNLGLWDRAGGALRATLRGTNAYSAGGPLRRDYEASWSGALEGALPVASEGGGPTSGAALSPPSPNPTHDGSRFVLSLPESGPVRVEALDALGRRVAVLYDGPAPAGDLRLTLDGRALPPGRYAVRARGTGFDLARTLTVAR